MKYDKIGILLKDYPFKNGAPYFHRELWHLSHFFKRIYLFANHQPPSDSELYFTLPENVVAVNIASERTEQLSVGALLSNGFAEAFGSPLDFLTRLRALHYYSKQAKLLEFNITSYLNRENIEPEEMVWYSYWSDELAMVLAQMKRAGIIRRAFSRTHNHDIYENRHPARFLPYRNMIFDQLDAILCISEHGKNHLTERFAHHHSKFLSERLGVKEQAARKCCLNTDAPIKLVSLSAILPVKQLSLLITVLASWDGKPIEWHHIGSGKHKPYEQEIINSAINSLNKNRNVTNRFHGFITPNKIIPLLSEINPHFLVNTSTFEGIPVSMMEACSLGIPIIGPDVCGVPEIIEHRKNGYLFSPTNPDEFLNIFHEIENLEESEYQDLRVNALNMQRQRFSADTNYNRLAAILKGETKVG